MVSETKNKIFLDVFLISLSLLVFFSCIIGKIGLTNPDETFYAETAEEMLSHHSYLTPLIFEKPQFEKPPLTYWLMASSFSIFGRNRVSARLPIVLFAIIGAISTYLFSFFVFNRKTAILSSLILATSLLYLGCSYVVLTDMLFTVFIALSLYCFFIGYLKERYQKTFWNFFYLFLALAVLTKGPLAVVIIGLTILTFAVFKKEFYILKRLFYLRGIIIFSVICLPWYLFMAFKYGKDFLYGFFIHENIGRVLVAEHKHNDHFYYYPLMMFLWLFPWSFWVFFIKRKIKGFTKEFSFLRSWFLAPLIFFMIAKSKLPSYILPIFPPLAILIGASVANLKSNRFKAKIISLSSVVFLIFLLILSSKLQIQFPVAYKMFFLILIGFSLIYILSNIFLWFQRYKVSFSLNILAVVFFVITAFNFISPKLEGSFSSKELDSIISPHKKADKTIVCNKTMARGIYYYADRPVVILNYDRHPFYTPHHLKILVTDKEIKKFFSKRDSVICVIKRADLERLNRIFIDNRENKIIKAYDDKFIVLSKKIR